MTETVEKKYYFDLDEVLETEVKFGKYQVVQFLLIAFPIFLNGIFSSSYIFTAGTLNYRCKIPQCDGDGSDLKYLTDWLNSSTPFNDDTRLPEKCARFQPVPDNTTERSCASNSFNRLSSVKCDHFVYEDDEFTILNKFNLNCDKEFYLSLIGTINNIGQMLCYIVTGFLSDRYGSKFVLIIGCLGSGLFGILRVFSSSYTQFAVFEFLDALFGAATFATAYIIGLELVTPRYRTAFGTLLNCFYAFGEIYLGFIAMWFRDYRTLLLITYPPAFLTIIYICVLPRSIRWLIMKGFNNEAKKIILKATKMNGTWLSFNSLSMLTEQVELRDPEVEIANIDASAAGRKKNTKQIILQVSSLSYLWFSTIFVYYGLNINAVHLEYWSKYVSFIVVCLIELPAYFMTNILMQKIGRKKTLCLGMIGSGIFCVLSEFVFGEMLKTICFVIGKLLITISFSCLYIFTVEVFPTNLRHRFFSICSVAGRIGSILTPLTPLLAQHISSRLPLILFSFFSLSSALFLTALPETLNRKLPSTVDESLR